MEGSPPVLDQAQAPAPRNGLHVPRRGRRKVPHWGDWSCGSCAIRLTGSAWWIQSVCAPGQDALGEACMCWRSGTAWMLAATLSWQAVIHNGTEHSGPVHVINSRSSTQEVCRQTAGVTVRVTTGQTPQEHRSQAIPDSQLLTAMTAATWPACRPQHCAFSMAPALLRRAHGTSGSPGAGSGADAPNGGLLGGRFGACVDRGVRGANRLGSSGGAALLEAFEATQGELAPAQAARSGTVRAAEG